MSRKVTNSPAGKISRRAVLRGLGVTMALPWLESAAALAGEGASSSAPVRLACLFSGNGFHGREWWAKGKAHWAKPTDWACSNSRPWA